MSASPPSEGSFQAASVLDSFNEDDTYASEGFGGATERGDAALSAIQAKRLSVRERLNASVISHSKNQSSRDARSSIKYERMSSMLSDGYALIDSLSLHEENSTSTKVPTTRHSLASTETLWHITEPFISSLGKSIEILSKLPTSVIHSRGLDDRRELTPYQPETRALLSTILHLSAFSILGEALRIFVGRLFGGECTNADTPWLYSAVTSANLCVTSDGEIPGGALFTDLPANMIGSFFMGLLQPSRDLGLINAMPIAFLNDRHWFQNQQEWGVVHLALRTGFCGSLTTFASWNTQMVRMMDGTVFGGTQFFSAVFGYIIGLEAALASLALGQTVAIWMHRYANPNLAKEEDVLMYAYAKGTPQNAPSTVNKALPDYERRYLASLLPNEERKWAMQNVSILEDLERWKISTDETRTCDANDEILTALHEIEEKVLVDNEEPREDLLLLAEARGWDVKSLQNFAKEAQGISMPTVPSAEGPTRRFFYMQTFLAAVPFVMAAGLLVAFAILDGKSEESEFYRTMWLSALLAPFGALLRWKLSSLNGRLRGSWVWFPLGTFTANIAACMISALVSGFANSSHLDESDASIHQMLYAIKAGFAGSMSTVSTYVAEGNMLQKTYPHHAKAHYYMIGSLVVACAFGLVIYCPIVRTGPA